MKHRIIKVGKEYFIQEKVLFWWVTFQGLLEFDYPFKTMKEAEETLRKLDEAKIKMVVKEYD